MSRMEPIARPGEADPDRAASEAAEARASLLAHDLRAAVSDVIGGIRLIDQSTLSPEARVQLERIRAAGETLARLMEEGLALFAGEGGRAASHPVNIQLSRFLYDLEMRWSGRAREKGIGFRLTVTPEAPPVICLDRTALDRILTNILANAVKFTDSGAVELVVERTAEGALRFVVSDNGPGFSPTALERLFQYEGRPADAPKPGTGLGMHISKGLTQRLGGRLFVENRAEGGAEVTLELPSRSWAVSAPDVRAELPDLSRVKVLVADDTPTNQAVIGNMLTRMGAEFEVAEDGVEALHWLEREHFDVALIDIEMPRLNGIEVIRAVRAAGRTHANMPIIAVTAYVMRQDRERIYAAGADAMLAKPLPGIEMFGMAIAAALARRDALAGGGAPAGRFGIAEGPAPGPAAAIDRKKFDHLLDIAGPEASRELLERLTADLGRVRENLRAALADDNRTGIRAETHVLIALAGAVGADALQSAAERLNLSAHRPQDDGRAALGAEALEGIGALIDFVAAEAARAGVTA